MAKTRVKEETKQEMSAFELKRLENLRKNQALLADSVATAKKIFTVPKAPAKPTTTRKKPKYEPVKREVALPTRRSSRVAGLEADSEVLKRKLEVEVEYQAEKAKTKRLRVNGDLAIGDMVVEGKRWSDVSGLAGLVRGAQPGVRTFTEDDVKETTDAELKTLREEMSGLNLYDKWEPNAIKITPLRIYSLAFHPMESKPLVFCGDKEGTMGIFDANQEADFPEEDDEDAEYPEPDINALKVHSRTITSFIFSPSDMGSVYTSSYDSSIRKFEIEKGKSVQVYAPADHNEDLPISAMDMPSNDSNMLLFSTLHGSLGRHDIRTGKTEAEIWSLCDQKIGGFSLHPLQPHLVATASLDRTVKIWDLRKISGKGDARHPALLGEHESRLSVSHASWSAGGSLATSSYDDTVKIYEFPEAGGWAAGHDVGEDEMKPKHVVKHNNQTGRWVTILKPQWQRQPKDGIQKFVIGNMNRFVDVFAANGEQLAQLGGDGISAVPAVAHFHPSLNWVAGGTASGKLCLWM